MGRRRAAVPDVAAPSDWGSAAMGAGGAGAVLVLITAGGVALASHTRGGAGSRGAVPGR